MKDLKNKLILRKDDIDIIRNCIRTGNSQKVFDHRNAEALEAEISRAVVVNKEDFPSDVVRLNSVVIIRDERVNKTIELKVVTPEKADIRKNMISVLSPVGTALIGFRKGEKITWTVPSGVKTFNILNVINA